MIATLFAMTALQAGVSAALALLFGFIGALGFIWLEEQGHPRLSAITSGVVLLPSAAPVLLFLLAVAKLCPWARGWTGIIFVHAALNTGLVAVALARSARARLGGAAELALIEGAGRLQFLYYGAWPALRRESRLLFLFVFTFCFASFAVPLTLGGSRATTVEVLIYQKLRIEGEWRSAVALAVLQMAVLLLLSLRAGTEDDDARITFARPRRLKLMAWAPGLLFALAPSLFLLAGMGGGFFRGASEVRANDTFVVDAGRWLAGSALVGIGTGTLTVVALLALAYVRPRAMMKKLWRGLTAPSPTLTGFALLFLWRSFGLASFGKIILGLGLLWLPTLFRYRWEALLTRLEPQVAVARVLGAGEGQIFFGVIEPQVLSVALNLGGLAAFWAWGDFALSRVVAERSLTLAMAAQDLMSSYRFDSATFVVWMAVVGGLLNYALFAGAGYVFGRKS